MAEVREDQLVSLEALIEQLPYLLQCSQCGHRLAETACGPTHALLRAQPWRHRRAPTVVPRWLQVMADPKVATKEPAADVIGWMAVLWVAAWEAGGEQGRRFGTWLRDWLRPKDDHHG